MRDNKRQGGKIREEISKVINYILYRLSSYNH